MSFAAYVEAGNRVLERLMSVTAALDRAGVRYVVAGGNAVVNWITRYNPSATRPTKEVDILVRKDDEPAVSAAMERGVRETERPGWG